MLKVEAYSSDDLEKSLYFNLEADLELGSAFGPKIPALVISRLICFPTPEILKTKDSRSSFLVTSQGPVGMISPPLIRL